MADLTYTIGTQYDDSGLRNLKSDIDGVAGAGSRSISPLSGVADSIRGVAGVAQSGTLMLGQIGLAIDGVKAIAGTAASAISGLTSSGAEYETYRTQLGTLLGGTEQAKERLAELAKFGAETPFELPQLVAAEKVLLGFGLTGEKAVERTGLGLSELRTVIGDVAAATGQDFGEMAGYFARLQTGTSTGEILQRFTELGIASKETLAEVGVDFDESGKMVTPIGDAMVKIMGLMQDKFGGGMKDLSATFSGQVSTMQDTLSQLKRGLTAPIFEVAKAGLSGFLPVLGGFAAKAEAAGQVFSEGFTEGMQYAVDDGFTPLGAAIMGFSGGLESLGLEGVAKRFETFGAFVERLVDDFGEGGFAGVLRELPDVLADLGIDPALGESIANLITKFRELFGSLSEGAEGFSLETTLVGIIDAVTAALPKLVDFGAVVLDVLGWLVDHSDLVLTVVGAFAGFKVLLPLVGVVTAFSSAIATLGPLISTVMTVLSAGGGVITALGAGLATLMGPIGAVGAALASGGLGGALSAIVALLGGPVTIAIAAVAALFAAYSTDFLGFGTLVDGVVGGLSDAWNGLVGLLTGSDVDLAATVSGWVDGAVEAISSAAGRVKDAVAGWFGGIELPSLFGGGEEDEALKGMSEAVAKASRALGDAAVSAGRFEGNMVKLSDSFGGQSSTMADQVNTMFGALAEEYDRGFVGLKAAIKGDEFFGAVLGPIGDSLDSARDALSEFGNVEFQGGSLQMSLQSLWDDLGSMGEWASSAGEGVRGAILAAFNVDIGQGAEDMINQVSQLFGDLGASFDEFFSGGSLTDLARNLIEAWYQEFLGLPASVTAPLSSLLDVIDGAWASFDAAIQSAQDAIYEYLLGIWLQIPADIRADLELIADHLAEKFEEYRQSVEDKMTEISDAIVGFLQAWYDEFVAQLGAIGDEAKARFNAVKDAVLEPMRDAAEQLKVIWSSVIQQAKAAWSQVQSAVMGPVNDAVAGLTATKDRATAAAREAFAGVVTAIGTALQPVKDAVVRAIETALAYLSGLKTAVEGYGKAAFHAFVVAAENVMKELRARIVEPVQGALAGVKATAAEWIAAARQMGENLINGVVSAIVAGKERLITAALDGVRGLLDAVKAFLGIASDSKVMYQVGRWTMGGLAGGIEDGVGDVVDALGGLEDAFDDVMAIPWIDRAFEASELARAKQGIADITAVLQDAKAAAEQAASTLAIPFQRVTDVITNFFSGTDADSFPNLLADMAAAGKVLDEAAFFDRLGLFDLKSFDELQQRLADLQGQPEEQEELWSIFIDGLIADWDRYYEAVKAALEAQLEGLESESDAYKAIQAQIEAWDDRNSRITDGIGRHGDLLAEQMGVYGRMKQGVEELQQAVEDLDQALAEAIEREQKLIEDRRDAALDSEQEAHDQTMALLDDEAARRERARKDEERAEADRRKRVEAEVERELADLERLHESKMAAITAEVDAQDATLEAERDRLDRAKLYLDLVAQGTELTEEQKKLLESIGIDAAKLTDPLRKLTEVNLQLTSTTTLLEKLRSLVASLPDEKRVRTTLTDKQREALQAALDAGKVKDEDRRIVEIALAGRGVRADRLREILEGIIGDEDAGTGLAGEVAQLERTITLEEDRLKLARDRISVLETLNKLAQLNNDDARKALQAQLLAEDALYAAEQKRINDRLQALAAEEQATRARYEAESQALKDVREQEESRHEARMQAIQAEYALQLLRLGKSEAEVQDELTRQAEAAARIASEAQRRFEEALRAAGLAPPVAGPPVTGGGPALSRPGQNKGGSNLPGGPPPGTPRLPPVEPPEPPLFPFLADLPTDQASTTFDALNDTMSTTTDHLAMLLATARDLSTVLGVGPAVAPPAGPMTVNRNIIFNGDVTIDRDLADEIGLVDAVRLGAP